ncbi:MAG: threonine--tRNA ligase, partial [Rhodospirillaceae bacterium]|nr:threonine--tRNA ligase [Rhodospirillaceae bacterium]
SPERSGSGFAQAGDSSASVEDEAADERRLYALKPMSCPGHIQIFNAALYSYRELPVRFSEFGACHRNEPSGALSGLMRLRAFTQDDAHIFCTEDQVVDEVAKFCRMLSDVYADFGFADVKVAFSTRPSVRAGENATWDKAEQMLEDAAKSIGLAYVVQPGEGAFYGPKLEFVLTDSRNRAWQCGTVQLDMVLPERLNVAYVNAEGRKVRPVMIHHAVLGSLERFIAVLLEHYEGKLPLWLAPDQVVVAAITDAQDDYAKWCLSELEGQGFRAVADLRSDRIGRKVADALSQGVPVIMAVGAREEAEKTVSLRRGDQAAVVLPLAYAMSLLRGEAFK